MILLALWFLAALCWQIHATCPTPSTNDAFSPIPAAPGFPTVYVVVNSVDVQDHWSETVRPYRAPVALASSSRTNCPHQVSGLRNWHDPSAWPGSVVPTNDSDVTIPASSKILISGCSLPSSFVFRKITISGLNTALVFADADIELKAKNILVTSGGKLLAGSETCRLQSKVTITLVGRRSEQTVIPPADLSVKGILVQSGSQIELHGTKFTPTWTRLAKTAFPSDTTIYVQDVPNWIAGQTIFISTTELKDSRDWHRNEYRVISSISRVTVPGSGKVAAITLTQALSYKHYGGREYQAEVALLDRNLVVQGWDGDSEATDLGASCVDTGISTYPCNNYLTGFGAHIRVEGDASIAHFEGVGLKRVGQTNVLGRYPIHFHMMGQNLPWGNAYVRDCAVWHSYFRAFAVHGTNQVLLSENVAVDVVGHAFFASEDGIEENSTFSYNYAAHVHPIGTAALVSQSTSQWWDGGQQLFDVVESPSLILPSDTSASCFYITNAYNRFIGNGGSGGWSGAAFPNLPAPVKVSGQYGGGGGRFRPKDRPLLEFKGNTFHSTGYWWGSAGAVYVGGKLSDNGLNGPLTYNAGRADVSGRDTCNVEPFTTYSYCTPANFAYMVFEDTKVFLANKGLQNWGQRSEVIRFEAIDVTLSSNVFGSVFLNDWLVQCRSLNHLPQNMCPTGQTCAKRDLSFRANSVSGFEWYDTGQSHVATNIVFRNCKPNWAYCSNAGCGQSATWKFLTHSDQFIPGLMQASRNITYQNYDASRLTRFTNLLSDPGGNTTSGRLQSWADYDGSVYPGVLAGIPIPYGVMLGSSWGKDFWKLNSDCVGPKNDLWICPNRIHDSAASVFLYFNPSIQDAIGVAECGNGYWVGLPCTNHAVVTHFGRSLSVGMSVSTNAKITGPIIAAHGGWFVRFNQGTPRVINVKQIQVAPRDMLIMAFPYPRGTTFSITAYAASWCNPTWSECSRVFTASQNYTDLRSGFGDRYLYDGTNQLLFIRIVQKNEGDFGAKNAQSGGPWRAETIANLLTFQRAGIVLMKPNFNYRVEIVASSCGGAGPYCAQVTESSSASEQLTDLAIVEGGYVPSSGVVPSSTLTWVMASFLAVEMVAWML